MDRNGSAIQVSRNVCSVVHRTCVVTLKVHIRGRGRRVGRGLLSKRATETADATIRLEDCLGSRHATRVKPSIIFIVASAVEARALTEVHVRRSVAIPLVYF